MPRNVCLFSHDGGGGSGCVYIYIYIKIIYIYIIHIYIYTCIECTQHTFLGWILQVWIHMKQQLPAMISIQAFYNMYGCIDPITKMAFDCTVVSCTTPSAPYMTNLSLTLRQLMTELLLTWGGHTSLCVEMAGPTCAIVGVYFHPGLHFPHCDTMGNLFNVGICRGIMIFGFLNGVRSGCRNHPTYFLGC